MTRAPSATTILAQVKTRTGLRVFIDSELPGWAPWLTLAAAEVQRHAWDTHLLKTEGDLIKDIRNFASEFVAGVGPDAERLFMPFLQQLPDRALHGDLPAIEPFTTNPGELPFSHEQLRDRMPSRVLIGLIGALGLRQQLVATGKRKHGRAKNVRLEWALTEVANALLPFVKTRSFEGDQVGDVVAPAVHHRDPSFPSDGFRREPLSLALVAVVAIYLSLPNRKDPEQATTKPSAPADPERLRIPSTLLKETTERLREVAKKRAADAQRIDQLLEHTPRGG